MKAIKKGDKGSNVKVLQQSLQTLGYTIDTDGLFGNDTLKVLLQFQQDNNLAADGVAGSNTMAVLNDLVRHQPVVGIDVSHHNGVINWALVARAQVGFVFCKASQGKAYKDEMLLANMNELKRLGFIRGAYHFFTFKDVTAKEQTANFLGCGIDFSMAGTLPPVLDIEWQQSDTLNQFIISNRADCIKKIKDWLDIVEKTTGRKPILYTNSSFWKDYLGNPLGFETYPLWVASYRKDNPVLPAGWKGYAFWQFTESGSVMGITGNVDKNIFKQGMKQLKQMALLEKKA